MALLHSRGFEKDVRTYIELAGFTPDLRGIESLSDVSLRKFYIRDLFFFVKQGRNGGAGG